jgi:uncharacterized protein (DUF486 family)
MSSLTRFVLMLGCANVVMTVAWDAHLKNLSDRPWYVAALLSVGIAVADHLLQVPAPQPLGGALHHGRRPFVFPIA